MISRTVSHIAVRKLNMSIAEKNRPYKIAIVGAGAAGLGAARWLLDNVVDAKDESASSIEVTVFEARGRIGGRVHTYAPDSATAKGMYDVGASWIHDPSSNPLTVMAKSMQLKTKETDFGEEVLTDLSGKRWDERSSEKTFSRYEKELFAAAAAARKAGMQDRSLGEVLAETLDMTSPLHNLYLSGLEFELGTPLRNCSACECIDDDWINAVNGVGDSNSTHLPSYNEPCDMLLHEGGYSELLQGIVSGAATDKTTMQPGLKHPATATERIPMDVRLSHEVVSIRQNEPIEGAASPAGITIAVRNVNGSTMPSNVLDSAAAASSTVFKTTGEPATESAIENTEYAADAVIVTVPLGVLKASCIAFTPPLSAPKQLAINQIGFGNVVKVIMEFNQVFWPTHTPFLSLADAALADPQHRGLLTYFLNGHHIAGKKVLVSYGLGEAADTVDKMSDEELTALIMSRMASISLPGRKLPAAPLRVIRTRWAQDPYALGAYSYWAPGNKPGIRAELGRREGNVWFAGEAVQESSLLSSSVHGAWLSGVTAAAEVCQHLQLPVTLPTTIAPLKKR